MSYFIIVLPIIVVLTVKIIGYAQGNLSLKAQFGGSRLFLLIAIGVSLIGTFIFWWLLSHSMTQYTAINCPPILVQKNVVTATIDRSFRHNAASGGIISSKLTTVKYLQLALVFPILISFLWVSYLAIDDMDNSLLGQLLFFEIFILLIWSVINFVFILTLIMLPVLIQQEIRLQSQINALSKTELESALSEATVFYSQRNVSKAQIRKNLLQYEVTLSQK